MATKGERQALLFLAAVALLGAGTRLYRARHLKVETTGIDRQIEAVEQSQAGQGTRRAPKRRRAGPTMAAGSAAVPLRVDLDRAPAAEMEKLPGIGPALARRIIDDREANGPFGCLAALDDIKGIGPALLKRLDSLATFSGPGRPACSGAGTIDFHSDDEEQENRDGDDDHAGETGPHCWAPRVPCVTISQIRRAESNFPLPSPYVS